MGEALRAQDAREDTLAVEDVLTERHRALLQGADAVQNLLVDRVLRGDILREGGNLLGNELHQVGIEVDAYLEELASALCRLLLYISNYHLTINRIIALWVLAVITVVMTGVILSIYIERFGYAQPLRRPSAP